MPELTPETRLQKALERMKYDDALHFIGTPTDPIALSPYHVEYLKLERGMVQYRLFHQNKIVGVENITDTRDNRKLEWVRIELAKYLIGLGLGDMGYRLVPMGTITPIDARTSRLPRLNLPPMPDNFRKVVIPKAIRDSNYD